MNTVTIKIRNSEIALNCNDPQKLEHLASRFNERLSCLKETYAGASDLKLSLILGVMLEDEIDMLYAQLQESKPHQEQELNANIATTINQIAEYIDQLATRIESS